MLTLRKLRLQDFLSHESTELSFEVGDKYLIDGISGAGKSSVIDAVVWALYGVSRSDNKNLVRKGGKKAQVDLVLDKDGVEYTVQRSITAGGKHTLNVLVGEVAHDLTGVRELQAWIEKDLVGASYALFTNSIAYLQNSQESFVLQTAVRRKDMLIELVGTVDLDGLLEKTKNVISLTKTEYVVAETRMGSLTELNKQSATARDSLPKLEDDADTMRMSIITLKSNLEIAQKKVQPQLDIEKRRNELQVSLQSLKAVKQGTEHEIASFAVIRESMKGIQAEIAQIEGTLQGQDRAVLVAAIESIQSELGVLREFEEKKRALERERPVPPNTETTRSYVLGQIASMKGSPTCPAGENCPHEQGSHKALASLNATLVTLDEQEATYGLAKEKFEKEMRTLTDTIRILSQGDASLRLKSAEEALHTYTSMNALLDSKKLLLQSKEETLSRESVCVENLANTTEAITKHELSLAELPVVDDLVLRATKAEIHTIQHELAIEEPKLREQEAKIAVVKKQIEDHQKRATDIEGLSVQLSNLDAQMQDLEALKTALGANGIQVVLIDHVIPTIEDRINLTLMKMSDFRVRLDTQRVSSDEKKMVEGLFITIINDMGEEMPFENYSGGERLKIIVSISEALASFQNVGFRLYDETFMGLDENSTESFVAVLDALRTEFSQILCVSHILQIKELFDQKITITKRNGISYARTE